MQAHITFSCTEHIHLLCLRYKFPFACLISTFDYLLREQPNSPLIGNGDDVKMIHVNKEFYKAEKHSCTSCN